MMDVLEVYERPYDSQKPVVCLDEKNKQLLEDTKASLSVRPGVIKKQDYEYIRRGTVNLFVAIEPKASLRKVTVTKRRTKKDFAHFIKKLVGHIYKGVEKIIMVVDNLNTHNETSLIETFGEIEGKSLSGKIEWHYTPNHASWLNQAEIEISAMTRQCLKRRTPSFQAMQHQVAIWAKERNQRRIGIKWQFTREKARQKFQLQRTGILKE
jgi:hypothetical protein